MNALDSFQIPWHTHALAGTISRFSGFWKWLGNLETAGLKEELSKISIEKPIYICGLARSGSTILLESIASQPKIATHQYRDFPGIFIPYWWNHGGKKQKSEESPRERAHRDGLMVTTNSPEAMEEILWMAFFADLHNPSVSQVMTKETSNPEFESFYRDHIQKMILTRKGERFASKENYNITRMQYLLKLFPDAKFVIPIREPLHHVASLIKQHKLFIRGEQKHPRALEHMRRVGHFEFGLDMRPINTNNSRRLEEIDSLWKKNDEARGWARYWSELYRFVAELLESDSQLRDSAILVPFETLCQVPEKTLSRVMSHCDLTDDEAAQQFSQKIQAPTYYQPEFTKDEINAIDDETRDTVDRLAPFQDQFLTFPNQ
ncbi:MAG: sulfotransferase [Planctomycetaceae bacterium]|nr:sulfotransferase [Planctomycetaceae bacterium]